MNTPLRAPVLRAAVAASVLWLCGAAAADEASQNVEAIAEKVEKRAERTEKAEGKHDLVEDSVRTKTGTGGEKVVEQVGEASYYGKGFHGKKTAGGEKFDQGDLTAAHPTLPLGSEAKVRVPNVEEEDARRLHRELGSLKKERTRHRNRIRDWLVAQGLRLEPHRDFLQRLETLTLWDGTFLPAELKGELEREYRRLSMVEEQLRALEQTRTEWIAHADSHPLRQVVRLMGLRDRAELCLAFGDGILCLAGVSEPP